MFYLVLDLNEVPYVNGKIVCRKLTKKNVGFPTYFLYSQSMI